MTSLTVVIVSPPGTDIPALKVCQAEKIEFSHCFPVPSLCGVSLERKVKNFPKDNQFFLLQRGMSCSSLLYRIFFFFKKKETNGLSTGMTDIHPK